MVAATRWQEGARMMQAGSGLVASALGIPFFLLYIVLGAAILVMFVFVYSRITAHDELALIREGNATAAIALTGTIIGFTIPLAKAIAQAGNIGDMLLWGFAAFIVQLVAYMMVRLMIPDLSAKIASNMHAAGILLAGCSIACGLVNAAAMTI
jgi:putative membrane protein